MTGVIRIETTVESEAAAAALAAVLVEERLAACVQVLGPIASTYRWKGRLDRASEWLCLVKTSEARGPAVLSRIRQLHSYEQPEILVIPVSDGDRGCLDWIREETAP